MFKLKIIGNTKAFFVNLMGRDFFLFIIKDVFDFVMGVVLSVSPPVTS